MKRCRKCVMPDTAPNITLDKNGVCNHCKAHEENQKVDWDERWKKLEDLCNYHRRKDGSWDCVIAVSGGKDSHYQVGLFKEKLGMNPVCVSVDNYSWTQTGRKNIQNLNERFDVNIITLTPHRKTLKFHTRKDFEEELHPNKYWDRILYSFPMEIARQYGIRLVIWGEDTQYRNSPDARILINKWMQWSHYDVIFTSYFVPWNRYDNLKYAVDNGFISLDVSGEWSRNGLEYFDYEQIDTIGYLINNYCKFVKFGYSTITELCSDAIRLGYMSRAIGIELVNDNDHKVDTKMLLDFCQFIHIEPNYFWEVINKHANKELVKNIQGTWVLKEDAM